MKTRLETIAYWQNIVSTTPAHDVAHVTALHTIEGYEAMTDAEYEKDHAEWRAMMAEERYVSVREGLPSGACNSRRGW